MNMINIQKYVLVIYVCIINYRLNIMTHTKMQNCLLKRKIKSANEFYFTNVLQNVWKVK